MLKKFWNWLWQDNSNEPTRLEQELARRIDYLEIELHQEREKYRLLVERIAFPEAFKIPSIPQGPFQSLPNDRLRTEAKRLSQLSRQRLNDQIAEMESRAASISARDEKLSSEANAEEKKEVPPEHQEQEGNGF